MNFDPSDSIQKALEKKRLWFESSVDARHDSLELNRISSGLTDQMISSLLKSAEGYGGLSGRVAILALGGYGRMEMGPHCDIDLLFLYDSVGEEGIRRIAEGVLYPFWDRGVEIGGATRTLGDCRSIIEGDAVALTAMLDARLILGNEGLYDSLIELLTAHFSSKQNRIGFIDAKLAERGERLKRFGDSIYLVQPNIKESEGGLRDYQTLRWILKAVFFTEKEGDALRRAIPSDEGRREIAESLRFLWRIRHLLHLIDGKKNDRLSEDVQEEVARRMGFVDGRGISATEQLMSQYYRHASGIHLQCARAADRIRNEIDPPGRLRKYLFRRRLAKDIFKTERGLLTIAPNSLKGDALMGLRAFSIAKDRSLALDARTKDIIAREESVDAETLSSDEACRIWRGIFSNLKNLDRTLSDMNECNCLGRWFPEMQPMLHLIQHDGFHIYTAGVHSIKAVAELVKLAGRKGKKAFPRFARALDLVSRPHVLIMATIFHDVGKGRGEGHSERGAILASNICRRLGYPPHDADDVAFLVRSHLLMALLAFRRDIGDKGLLARFSQSARSPEMLAMLHLLTFSDIRAIGPNVWNDWKSGLLSELHERTQTILSAGGITPEHRRREARKKIARIRRHLGRAIPEAEIESYLASLPERYAFSISPETISAHIIMSREIAGTPVATTHRIVDEMGCSEFSVVTADKPGLFAMIAGILAANGANIAEASLNTTTEGVAVDIFWITDHSHRPLNDPEKWQRIREEMTRVISGEEDIGRMVAGRFKRRLLCWPQRYRAPKVTVDNDVSPTETVIEIAADDRRGLLYTIASTLHELGLTIDRALISTHVDRVIDVFYIRDSQNRKVSSNECLDEIRRRLLQSLEE